MCVFLGAGASKACGLPDTTDLQTRVGKRLKGASKQWFNAHIVERNLEQLLSRVRRIASVLEQDQSLDGLSRTSAQELDRKICRAIVKELDIAAADAEPMRRLAAWVARCSYRSPLEIFTVNYDLLIESGLEALRVPYFDGFVGALQGRFHTELVESQPWYPLDPSLPASFARLWKIHGSVNWTGESGAEIFRLGSPIGSGLSAAIYPSDAKYDESRRVPFVVLQDRLRRSLSEPETLLLVSGYSFGDDHLNEMLFDAARRRERSEFMAFCYDSIPDALAQQAEETPNLQAISGTEAIIGGRRGAWRAAENDLGGFWAGGKLALHDFRSLATFLARMVPAGTRLSDAAGHSMGEGAQESGTADS